MRPTARSSSTTSLSVTGRRRHPELERTRAARRRARVARAQTLGPLEVVVVDNGSADGRSSGCARAAAVEVVALADNAGFAAGVNRGLERAAASSSPSSTTTSSSTPTACASSWRGFEPTRGPARRPGRCCASTTRASRRAGDRSPGRGPRCGAARASPTRAVRRPGRVSTACAGAALYRRSASRTSGCSRRPSSPTSRTSTGACARSSRAGVPLGADRDRLPRRLGHDSPRGQARPVLLRAAAAQQRLDGAQNYPASALLRYAPVLLVNHAGLVYVAVRDGMARAHWRGAAGRRPRAAAGAATAARDPGRPARRAAGARAADHARAAAPVSSGRRR